MTKHLAQYRQLERRLWMTRWRREGEESPEEDMVLDEMERKWMSLTAEERTRLSSEGPRCWPMDSFSPMPRVSGTLLQSSWQVWEYEGFGSPAEAILSADAA
jgi:hypothetical protein